MTDEDYAALEQDFGYLQQMLAFVLMQLEGPVLISKAKLKKGIPQGARIVIQPLGEDMEVSIVC